MTGRGRTVIPNGIGVAVAAVLGAGVVFSVHYGRPRAEQTRSTCNLAADCLGKAWTGDLVLAVVIVAVSVTALFLAIGRRRAFTALAMALAIQGLLMLFVELVDGFWLPLPLDVVIGIVSWSSAAVVAGHRTTAQNAK